MKGTTGDGEFVKKNTHPNDAAISLFNACCPLDLVIGGLLSPGIFYSCCVRRCNEGSSVLSLKQMQTKSWGLVLDLKTTTEHVRCTR